MVSAVWLFGAACMGFLHPYHPSAVVAFCLSVGYYLLFRTYQQVQPMVNVFHTFVMLAVGSLFWPPFIFLAPFFLWYLIVFMRSLTFRAFFAALIGLSLPFWFWIGYLLLQEDISPLRSWAGELNCLHVGTWQELTAPYVSLLDPASAPVLAFLVLTVLTVWTSVYYLLNNYDDKIRTRMMFYIFIIQSAMIVVFTVLTRQFRFSLPLLLLSESPLIAHYFTLRNTWLSLFVFTLSLVAFIGLAILTLFPDFIINFVNPLFMSE